MGSNKWVSASALGLAAALAIAACVGGASSTEPALSSPPRTESATVGWSHAWAEIPAPPGGLTGGPIAASGERDFVIGGRTEGSRDCLTDSYAWTASTGWTQIAAPPVTLCEAESIDIGGRLLFATGTHGGNAAIYDPATDTWGKTAKPPAGVWGHAMVWTGKEVLTWGSVPGESQDAVVASYDPHRDAWHTVPQPPIQLNLSDGVWTGEEYIVFGSQLDHGNHADTPTSVGAAYDPAKRSWKTLRPSALSAQATAASWDGHDMIAWDYETKSQAYNPKVDRWASQVKMPMDFNECYPEDVEVGTEIFAWFCGAASLWRDGAWIPVDGGPMDVTVHAYDQPFPVYRFMDLAATDARIFLRATGVTVMKNGTVCYGCKGSPTSYWQLVPSRGPIPCPKPGGLTPELSETSIRLNGQVTLSGASPVYADDGSYVGPHGGIQVWLGLDPEHWKSALPGGRKPVPATRGKPVSWAAEETITGCDYSTVLRTATRKVPGTYPVVVIFRDGKAETRLPPVTLTITDQD